MKRRTFSALLAGGALAASSHLRAAQAPRNFRRIGYLAQGALPIPDLFFANMRELGWVEGKDFTVEARYAVAPQNLSEHARELVGSGVDLIFANSTPAAVAARDATSTIPIVFMVAADPVMSGLVNSIARPGSNLTGWVWGFHVEKSIEALKAALPRLRSLAFPAPGQRFLSAIVLAAKELDVQLEPIELRPDTPLDAFFRAARKRADAVLIQNIPWTLPVLDQLGREATRSGIAAIGPARPFATGGGLLTYGPTFGKNGRACP